MVSKKKKKPALLYNKYSREDLKKQIDAEPYSRTVLSFYRYVMMDEPHTLRDTFYAQLSALGVLGRIYVAHEGVNAQVSVPEPAMGGFVQLLDSYDYFRQMPLKIAVEQDKYAFLKLMIKVKKNIVADGLPPTTYDITNVGIHLTAQQWNDAMDDPDAVVVDVRNHYESEIGHFRNALRPEAATFKEELPEILDLLENKKEKKILLYCTGGIRCEKASAYLKHHGFGDVNQLHGGIIDYARQVKEEGLQNQFKGKNFVFDERLGERISEEIISQCHQCGEPADTHVNCKNVACNLLFIQCTSCQERHQGCCSPQCIDYINGSNEQKPTYPNKVFHNHQRVDLRTAFEE